MFTYEYGCKDCGYRFDSTIHSNYLACPACSSANAKRRWTQFNTTAIQIEPVYNPSLGRMVRSSADFREGLKVASADASERLGHSVNYQPVDPRDTKALGVSSEGLVRSEQKRIYDEAL